MKKHLAVMLLATLVLTGCGKEKKERRSSRNDDESTNNRKSALGESCTKTADCEGAARCIKNTCQGGDRESTDDKGFIIKFERPVTAGLRYKITNTGNLNVARTVNGEPQEGHSIDHDFEGEVTVKAVHASGKATKLEIKVARFETSTEGNKAAPALARNTIILAESVGSEEKFTVNGKPVPEEVEEVLSRIISLYDGNPIGDDAVFGAVGRKRPGDSWKPNAGNMITGLNHDAEKFTRIPKASDITGRVTFEGTKKVNGMDVLEIEVRFTMKNAVPIWVPFVAQVGYSKAHISGWLPQDPDNNTYAFDKMRAEIHFEGKSEEGEEIVLHITGSEVESIAPID